MIDMRCDGIPAGTRLAWLRLSSGVGENFMGVRRQSDSVDAALDQGNKAVLASGPARAARPFLR